MRDYTSNVLPLQFHCDYNGKMAEKNRETESFSITLPREAIEMLEKLIPVGLYGKKRATVASQLILDHMKQLVERGILK